MTEVEPVLDFASSGRSGRRNALPDILGSPAGVNPGDLPLKLAELSLEGKIHKVFFFIITILITWHIQTIQLEYLICSASPDIMHKSVNLVLFLVLECTANESLPAMNFNMPNVAVCMYVYICVYIYIFMTKKR